MIIGFRSIWKEMKIGWQNSNMFSVDGMFINRKLNKKNEDFKQKGKNIIIIFDQC